MKRFMHTHSRTVFNKLPQPKIYQPLPMKPILFDVSLRDGIQGANPLDYPTEKKLDILKYICNKYSPSKIELGSFVSPKVLPIMGDTAKLFENIQTVLKPDQTPDIYALVPNKTGLMNAVNVGFTNFSFITSVSNAFQVKNTMKNLLYKKVELQEMMEYVAKLSTPCKSKLYISCINECPIAGPIDRDFIIYEILSSYGSRTDYDELCLSDTIGTLNLRDFEYIVDCLIKFGIASSRISVHLHINSDNEREAKKILFACFKRKIYKFDVSVILEGGCSVTMGKNKIKPNMTYDFLNLVFEEYQESESD
jgi:isopropylmalate/homocitrate/citramalate synthase